MLNNYNIVIADNLKINAEVIRNKSADWHWKGLLH